MAKITDAELEKVNDLRNKLANVVNEVGQLTLQSTILRDDIDKVQSQINAATNNFKTLLQEEEELAQGLLQIYGVGSINFETGEFTPES